MSGAVLFWILFWSLLMFGGWAIVRGGNMLQMPRL